MGMVITERYSPIINELQDVETNNIVILIDSEYFDLFCLVSNF